MTFRSPYMYIENAFSPVLSDAGLLFHVTPILPCGKGNLKKWL
jgi:hypothetical protein